MDRKAAIEQIRTVCDTIARELMKVHPAVPAIQHEETQKVIYETVYELTKNVETIKKKLIRLQGSDDSKLL
jgi:thymidylate synthase ThyX